MAAVRTPCSQEYQEPITLFDKYKGVYYWAHWIINLDSEEEKGEDEN